MELYDQVIEILSPKVSHTLPNHELTYEIVKNIFPYEEARILVQGIKRPMRPVTVRKIKRRIKESKNELKKKLKDMVYKGKLIKIGPWIIALGYMPGLFEIYFTANRDDPERIKKAAVAHYQLLQAGLLGDKTRDDYPFFRVLPAIEPLEETIEVNKSLKVEHDILPFEKVREYLKGQKIFAVQPCSCRIAAKLSGNPCKRSEGNFCVSTGILAKHLIHQDMAKEVSYQELIEIMKKAEKEGLVHHTINMKKTSIFMCNCCPCCCGVLSQKEDYKVYIAKSNMQPELNEMNCVLCRVCETVCPVRAISINGNVKIDLDRCIGCGLCASHCNNRAITLKKVKKQDKMVRRFTGIVKKLYLSGKRAKKKVNSFQK